MYKAKEDLDELKRQVQGCTDTDELTDDDFVELDALQPLPHPDSHDPKGFGPADDPLDGYDGPKILLYSYETLNSFFMSRKDSACDKETRTRLLDVADALWKRGQYRKLAQISPFHREDLASLQKRFPNFAEVIDYISSMCEIAQLKDRALRMTPILLSGKPGVGKTMFCEAIAKWIGSGFEIIRYDSAQSGSETSGSSSFWSNSAPGKIFQTLTRGEHANPVFFLDELDKAAVDSSYNPLGPLHGLLDLSAKHFEDLCFPLRIDASHIIYFAACNDVEKIPSPLRSRFRHFEIGMTTEQACDIAVEVASDIIRDLGPGGDDIQIDDACFQALRYSSPRRMRQALFEGIGRALSRGRTRVLVSDLAIESSSKPRLGFV